MNERIQVLSAEVIGQIAAGEVVERPSAAIKELVENALDAGATAVTVDIREGGLSSFRVTDNGRGIAPSDIRLAFERHATSKIRTAEDLYGVRTLGFRGEALASIAAVSHVKCTTRAAGFDTGLTLMNDGGVISDLRDAACPEGTTFVVRDLFYNAPVRKKFLKKPAYEAALVSELMARLILSRPDISFRYMSDGKTVYFSAGDGKLQSAALSIYGVDVLRQLTAVEGNMNGLVLSGFVGVGDVARGNRAHEFFFLNHRAMKSPLLSSAVENACRQRVTIGRFPMCILHLTMPFGAADVNVHPNKWEVRFQNERAVREAVEAIVSDALVSTQKEALTAPQLFSASPEKPVPSEAHVQVSASVPTPVPAQTQKPDIQENPTVRPPAQAPAVITRTAAVPLSPLGKAGASFREGGSFLYEQIRKNQAAQEEPAVQPVPDFKKEEKPREPEQVKDETVEKRFAHPLPRIIGVVFNTYILMEYEDQLLLCDQHAAHERILYEQLVRKMADAPVSQALLMPLVVKLSPTEYAAYEENREALRNAGFDVEPFGGFSVQLRGVPIVLEQPEAGRCLIDALDELISGGSMSSLDCTRRIMQMACKHAVKGGEEIPMDKIALLIGQIIHQDIPPTCPHGRPLMVSLTHTDLDKRFRRIQS